MFLSARPLVAAMALASAATLVGCSGRAAPAGPTTPQWEGELAQAFPDVIDPAALDLPQTTPPTTRELRDRILLADLIARVRVQTVSVERRSSGEPVYRITLQVASPRVLDRKGAGEALEIVIPPGSAAHGLAQSWDVRLRGRTFLGFFRTFDGGEGEPVVHFHLAHDSADIAARVERIMTLEEVKGS